MRAFQTQVIGRKHRESRSVPRQSVCGTLLLLKCSIPFEHLLAFGFAKLKMFPRLLHVGRFEVVHRKLLLLGQPNVRICRDLTSFRIACPRDVINAVHILKESRNSLQPVSQFGGDGKQIHAPTLLEISKLCDLQTIEHHLPANPPRAQRRRFPVVLFELDVMLPQMNAHRAQRL